MIMTRTRRFYNRWEKCRLTPWMREAFHPWAFRCMGHCHRCRDPTIAPTRRRTYQRMAALEIANAF